MNASERELLEDMLRWLLDLTVVHDDDWPKLTSFVARIRAELEPEHPQAPLQIAARSAAVRRALFGEASREIGDSIYREKEPHKPLLYEGFGIHMVMLAAVIVIALYVWSA